LKDALIAKVIIREGSVSLVSNGDSFAMKKVRGVKIIKNGGLPDDAIVVSEGLYDLIYESCD